jgi:hypothetical protein
MCHGNTSRDIEGVKTLAISTGYIIFKLNVSIIMYFRADILSKFEKKT